MEHNSSDICLNLLWITIKKKSDSCFSAENAAEIPGEFLFYDSYIDM